MAERGRHRDRSDVYTDHKSWDEDRHGRHYDSYDSRGRNQKPRDTDKRGSGGDSRAKQHRQRDVTSASDVETPAYRDHYHEGPSRL